MALATARVQRHTRHLFHDAVAGGFSPWELVAERKVWKIGTIQSLDLTRGISFSESRAGRFDSGASERTINAHVGWITRREAIAARHSWVKNRAVAAAKTGHIVTGFAIHI